MPEQKKKRGRPASADRWVTIATRVPQWIADGLTEKRKDALLASRSELVRQILQEHLISEKEGA